MAKGDGIFKIRNGKIYVHGTIGGKFYRKSTGKKLNQANKIWIKKSDPLKVLAEILGVIADTSLNESLESVANEALEIQFLAKNITHNHQRDKLSMLNNKILPFFKDRNLANITTKDIVNWLNLLKKKYSNSHVKAVKNVFKSIFDYAQNDLRIINYNPFNSVIVKAINLDTSSENTEVYTTEEIAKILKESKGWLKLFLDISLKYGLRPSESVPLKWKDIDFDNGTLNIQRFINNDNLLIENIKEEKKNKKHFRTISLFSDTLNLLKSHYEIRENEEWLFTNRLNKPFTQSRSIVDFHFKPFLKTIGVPYKTLYAARRSYASIMDEANLNLEEIQETMGHAKGSKVTEKHYISDKVLTTKDLKSKAKRQEEAFNSIVYPKK